LEGRDRQQAIWVLDLKQGHRFDRHRRLCAIGRLLPICNSCSNTAADGPSDFGEIRDQSWDLEFNGADQPLLLGDAATIGHDLAFYVSRASKMPATTANAIARSWDLTHSSRTLR
jgi:hypothetical protein